MAGLMETNEAGGAAVEEPPRIQALLDDIVLALLAGLIVPSIIFLGWSVVSLVSVPPLVP